MQMHMDTVAMPVNPPDATREAKPRVKKYRKQPHAKEREVSPGFEKAT